MNNRMQTIRVGLFFLLGLALLWVTFESLSGGQIFKKEGYTLLARFDTLKGLKEGDEVYMAGVKIGSVAKTRLSGRQAEAVLRIDPDVKIAADAIAEVTTSSLLGSNQIDVIVGSVNAAPLPPGALIHTRATTDMNAVIAQLGSLGNRMEQVVTEIGKNFGGPGGSLFNKIDKLVTDNGPKLTEAIANLQAITERLRKGEGTLGKLVNDPKLHDDLLASVEQLKIAVNDARGFVTNAQTLVDQVKAGKGTLGTLIYDEQTAGQIKEVAKNLRELSDKLNRGEGTLGKLMSDDALYREAQGVIRKVDRAVDGLNDQGPITAVGIAANALF